MELILGYITPGVLWVIFLLMMSFVVFVGITLSYHWKEYAIDSHKTRRFLTIYTLMTGFFLGLMAISIFLYSYGT
ncbi:MAG: hypothetical protein WD883_02740 [Candidatus Colwellbacteria bacterium]